MAGRNIEEKPLIEARLGVRWCEMNGRETDVQYLSLLISIQRRKDELPSAV